MADLPPELAQIFAVLNRTNPASASAPPLPPRDPRLISAPPQPSPPSAALTPPPRPDPRTITTLPAARRYIAKYLSTSQTILSQIAQLIKDQHQLERSWHAGREEITQIARERPGGAMGGQGGNENENGGKDGPGGQNALDEELREYDRKVMEKAMDMKKKMEMRLAGLGVPGFVGVELEGGVESRREVIRLLEDLAGDE